MNLFIKIEYETINKDLIIKKAISEKETAFLLNNIDN